MRYRNDDARHPGRFSRKVGNLQGPAQSVSTGGPLGDHRFLPAAPPEIVTVTASAAQTRWPQHHKQQPCIDKSRRTRKLAFAASGRAPLDARQLPRRLRRRSGRRDPPSDAPGESGDCWPWSFAKRLDRASWCSTKSSAYPSLLNEVHRAIESERRRFVLLGPSARRLKTSTEPSYFANCSMKSKKSTGVSHPVLSIWPLIPAEVICPNLLR